MLLFLFDDDGNPVSGGPWPAEAGAAVTVDVPNDGEPLVRTITATAEGVVRAVGHVEIRVLPRVPRGASFVVDCLLPPALADDVLGDLAERHSVRVARYGPRRAAVWYAVQASSAVLRLSPWVRWIRWPALVELVRRLLRG
jgi:hypothetical protein